MFTPVGVMLSLLFMVIFAIIVRETTELIPDSPFRLWVTRIAVSLIVIWFGSGLVFGVVIRRHNLVDVLLSDSVTAIILLLVIFRDEL